MAAKARAGKKGATKARSTKGKATKGKATKARATKSRAGKASAVSGRRARSVSGAELTKLTQAAVRQATGRPFPIIREPIWGFVLQQEAGALDVAARVTQSLSASAGEAGLGATSRARRLQPSVVLRPGTIIAGFFPTDLPFPVRF